MLDPSVKSSLLPFFYSEEVRPWWFLVVVLPWSIFTANIPRRRRRLFGGFTRVLAMKGVRSTVSLGLVVAVSAAVLSLSVIPGAVAGAFRQGSNSSSLPEQAREAHYLLQKENGEVLDMLEEVIKAALASVKAEGADTEQKQSLIQKLETTMGQVAEVVETAQQYASSEEDLLSKVLPVRAAIQSSQKLSRELLDAVPPFVDAQLRSDEAARNFLKRLEPLVKAVISAELSGVFMKEQRGIEVIRRVWEAAQQVSKRLAEDGERRYHEFAEVLKAMVSLARADGSD